MIAHVVRMTAMTASIILCTFLPFLPGRYDSAAVPLSMAAQVLGWLGLLLVPIGGLWMAVERGSRSGRTRYSFALIALIVSSVVWTLVSIVAVVESIALGIIALGLGAYAVVRLWSRARALRSATPDTASAVSAYLIIVPVSVLLLQLALADTATESSRARAIRNSAQLIADIEQHRVVNGRYPLSSLSVQPDYKPSVIGIKEYRYEPS